MFRYKVSKMGCGGCIKSVTRAVQGVEARRVGRGRSGDQARDRVRRGRLPRPYRAGYRCGRVSGGAVACGGVR